MRCKFAMCGSVCHDKFHCGCLIKHESFGVHKSHDFADGVASQELETL